MTELPLNPTLDIFPCDCGWSMHTLRIDVEPNGNEPIITVSVVNAETVKLSKRIRMAWQVLLGKEHVLSEIIVHRDYTRSFVAAMLDFGQQWTFYQRND